MQDIYEDREELTEDREEEERNKRHKKRVGSSKEIIESKNVGKEIQNRIIPMYYFYESVFLYLP